MNTEISTALFVYFFYYIVYIVFVVVFTIVFIIVYIEIKETKKNIVAKNSKENNREVFWVQRDSNFYCITIQSKRTSNKNSTTIISSKSLLNYACKSYRRYYKRSLDKEKLTAYYLIALKRIEKIILICKNNSSKKEIAIYTCNV